MNRMYPKQNATDRGKKIIQEEEAEMKNEKIERGRKRERECARAHTVCCLNLT